jgi:hypothetical protein
MQRLIDRLKMTGKIYFISDDKLVVDGYIFTAKPSVEAEHISSLRLDLSQPERFSDGVKFPLFFSILEDFDSYFYYRDELMAELNAHQEFSRTVSDWKVRVYKELDGHWVLTADSLKKYLTTEELREIIQKTNQEGR